MQTHKVLCALDTDNLTDAVAIVKKLAPHVGGFKIGHSLVLPHGLSVIAQLNDAGARRIFLDLKFHDIPNTVALAVRQASRFGVWMMTLHNSGGPAMLTAAVEEAREFGDETGPLLVGVSVLTSLDQSVLTNDLGVQRSLEEQITTLSAMAMTCGLDGVVCPPTTLRSVRQVVKSPGIIVTPGIRLPSGDRHDQVQVGTAEQALTDGADYLVIGRTLIEAPDPEATLGKLGFTLSGR